MIKKWVDKKVTELFAIWAQQTLNDIKNALKEDLENTLKANARMQMAVKEMQIAHDKIEKFVLELTTKKSVKLKKLKKENHDQTKVPDETI